MGVVRTTPARDASYNLVHYLRKRITFQNTTATEVGVLPAGAIVIGGGAQVVTAFNDSGTDVINIGTAADTDAYATLLDVSSVGFKALDELATHDDHSDTAEITVVAAFTGQNSNASAGVADIVISYIPKPGA